MNLKALAVVTAIAMAPTSAWAQAPSPAGLALATCLTRSATAEDHTILIRWVFVAMARHPTVSEFAAISDAQRVEANRQMGGLFNRLLLDSCPSETRAAFQSDGQKALEEPFRVLAESAMAGLMDHPDVNAGIVEMTTYIELDRLAAMVEQR